MRESGRDLASVAAGGRGGLWSLEPRDRPEPEPEPERGRQGANGSASGPRRDGDKCVAVSWGRAPSREEPSLTSARVRQPDVSTDCARSPRNLTGKWNDHRVARR